MAGLKRRTGVDDSPDSTPTPTPKKPKVGQPRTPSKDLESPSASKFVVTRHKKSGKDPNRRREDARRKNMKGVQVICPSDFWQDNGPALAGYLGFNDTQSLRDFGQKPEIKPIIDAWLHGE